MLDVASKVETILALPGGASLLVPDNQCDGAWMMVPMEGVEDPTCLALQLSMNGWYTDEYEDVRYIGDYMLVKCFRFDDEE